MVWRWSTVEVEMEILVIMHMITYPPPFPSQKLFNFPAISMSVAILLPNEGNNFQFSPKNDIFGEILQFCSLVKHMHSLGVRFHANYLIQRKCYFNSNWSTIRFTKLMPCYLPHGSAPHHLSPPLFILSH